jgi:hypothetical protein
VPLPLRSDFGRALGLAAAVAGGAAAGEAGVPPPRCRIFGTSYAITATKSTSPMITKIFWRRCLAAAAAAYAERRRLATLEVIMGSTC